MGNSDFSTLANAPISVEQRLAMSRAAIADFLIDSSDSASNVEADGEAGQGESILGVGLSWLKDWWAHHPWNTTISAAAKFVEPAIQEVALRRPYALLAGAALAGALLVWSKPWRLLSTTALLGTLVGGLGSGNQPDAAKGLLSLARFALSRR